MVLFYNHTVNAAFVYRQELDFLTMLYWQFGQQFITHKRLANFVPTRLGRARRGSAKAVL